MWGVGSVATGDRVAVQVWGVCRCVGCGECAGVAVQYSVSSRTFVSYSLGVMYGAPKLVKQHSTHIFFSVKLVKEHL